MFPWSPTQISFRPKSAKSGNDLSEISSKQSNISLTDGPSDKKSKKSKASENPKTEIKIELPDSNSRIKMVRTRSGSVHSSPKTGQASTKKFGVQSNPFRKDTKEESRSSNNSLKKINFGEFSSKVKS